MVTRPLIPNGDAALKPSLVILTFAARADNSGSAAQAAAMSAQAFMSQFNITARMVLFSDLATTAVTQPSPLGVGGTTAVEAALQVWFELPPRIQLAMRRAQEVAQAEAARSTLLRQN